jgi:hypothetical protein
MPQKSIKIRGISDSAPYPLSFSGQAVLSHFRNNESVRKSRGSRAFPTNSFSSDKIRALLNFLIDI